MRIPAIEPCSSWFLRISITAFLMFETKVNLSSAEAPFSITSINGYSFKKISGSEAPRLNFKSICWSALLKISLMSSGIMNYLSFDLTGSLI